MIINIKLLYFCYFLLLTLLIANADEIVGCGGFVKSNVEIKFELIKVKLYTKQNILKYESDCAPTNGYYMVPVYDKGEYYLKVEAPLGWTFDPDTVELNIDWKNDKCSLEEDINFVFSGFGIAGKVTSFGQLTGPKGVILSLKSLETNKEVSKTLTNTNGVFSFEKILPGRYLIKASHAIWEFKKSESLVTVDKKSGDIESEIVVSGYDAMGKILSDGQPVQGVHFLLYSKSISQDQIEKCNTKILEGSPTFENLKYLCFVSSTSTGIFTFPVLMTGDYTLIPMYRNERIKYDVAPNKIEFVIEHDSFIIKDIFQVSGFVVSGKILTSPKGVGLDGASIIVNGTLTKISNGEGVYHLDSMKSGTYKIKVMKEGYVFRNIEVKINPAEPLLPDVYPIKYRVCGKIIFDQLPENSLKNLQFVINFETKEGRVVSSVTARSDNSFCELLSPQEYIIKVDTKKKKVPTATLR